MEHETTGLYLTGHPMDEYREKARRAGAVSIGAVLADLAEEHPEMKNYNVSVKRRKDEIIFLRKIIPGAADGSFGVDVARLAGLPDRVVKRARQILKELEDKGPTKILVPVQGPVYETQLGMDQTFLTDPVSDDIRKRIESLSPETMTPLEALNTLYELKKLTE